MGDASCGLQPRTAAAAHRPGLGPSTAVEGRDRSNVLLRATIQALRTLGFLLAAPRRQSRDGRGASRARRAGQRSLRRQLAVGYASDGAEPSAGPRSIMREGPGPVSNFSKRRYEGTLRGIVGAGSPRRRVGLGRKRLDEGVPILGRTSPREGDAAKWGLETRAPADHRFVHVALLRCVMNSSLRWRHRRGPSRTKRRAKAVAAQCVVSCLLARLAWIARRHTK